MRYLNKEDLITNAYERLIDESSKDDDDILSRTEGRAIALAATYMGRYDTDTIFGTLLSEAGEPPVYSSPIRHELLIEIIAKITLYNIFRRNAARKVPEDVKEDFDWAIKELERIRNGSIQLPDLPPFIDDDGNSNSNTMWGNNTNPDYYI